MGMYRLKPSTARVFTSTSGGEDWLHVCGFTVAAYTGRTRQGLENRLREFVPSRGWHTVNATHRQDWQWPVVDVDMRGETEG